MKLNDKIEIYLFEFFETGRFDYIKLGQTKEWILNNFPDPEDCANGNSFESASIWRYGNIEFYFNREEKLWMIFSDYIDTLSGGKYINLNTWILNKSNNLTPQTIIQELNQLRIGFSVRHHQNINQTKLTILESNIELSFNNEVDRDVNKSRLFAFALMQTDKL